MGQVPIFFCSVDGSPGSHDPLNLFLYRTSNWIDCLQIYLFLVGNSYPYFLSMGTFLTLVFSSQQNKSSSVPSSHPQSRGGFAWPKIEYVVRDNNFGCYFG